MKQLNIKLDDTTFSTLVAAAEARGMSVTQVARDRVLAAGQALALADLRDAVLADGQRTRDLINRLTTRPAPTQQPHQPSKE